MNRTLKLSLAAAAIAAVTTVSRTDAVALTATSNVAVSASVNKVCTMTNGSIGFGAYDPVSANAATPLDQSGTFTLSCTKGTPYSVALGLGGNAVGSVRNMKDGGAGGTNATLTYELYNDVAGGTVWGSATGLKSGTTASKAPITLTVFGRIPAGQDVPVATGTGGYTDSVVATVTY